MSPLVFIEVLRERDRLLLRKENPPWWSCISTRDLIRELQNVTACLCAHGLVSRGSSSSRSFFQAHSSRSRDSAAETEEGKGQRRKSRRWYSEVVVEGCLAFRTLPILTFRDVGRVDNKLSAEMRHGSLLHFYDESFREVRIEFRQWNWGRRRLVPKSQSRLLGFEREKSMEGIIPIMSLNLITD